MATRKKSPEKRPKAKAPPKRTEPKAKTKAAPMKPADTKVERFRQNLRCKLSPENLAEKSDRMAHVIGERENLIAEAKSATAHLKAQIKEKDAEIGKLSAQIRDKAEYREVDCERRFLYRTGKIVEVRLDTEEETYERALTLAERQLAPDALNKPAEKPDTSQAKASLEKALGHPVKEEDGPSNEDEKEETDEEAPDVPGSDEAPASEPEPEEDSGVVEDDCQPETGDVPAE